MNVSNNPSELVTCPTRCQPRGRQSNFAEFSRKQLPSYDDILEQLGQMGKFQLRTFLWLCLPAFYPGIVIMSYTFTGAIPNYRCVVNGFGENQTRIILFNSSSWFNLTIPIPWGKNNKSVTQCYHDDTIQYGNIIDSSSEKLLEKCNQWVYDTSVHHSTIVTEFNLICDNEWKQTLASSLFMLGMLVGGFSIGTIGDIIGRRKTFTVNVFVLACLTTASAFSPDWVTFCVMRFFSGLCTSGHFLIIFVWGIETVGKKYRIVCGLVYHIIFALGSAVLGLVAYFVRNWRILQLVISVPMFGLTALFWIVPESISWLITKRHYPQARKLVLCAAHLNGAQIPESMFTICDEAMKAHEINKETRPNGNISMIEFSSIQHDIGSEPISIKTNAENMCDIFRSKVLAIRLIVMFLAWIAAIMAFYGITYSTTNFLGNFYINYELSVVMEIPAYIFGMFAVEKVGRKPILSGGLLLSGIACLITGLLTPPEMVPIKIMFSLIGKLFVALVIAILFSYTSELFPTSVRTAMVGLCSTIGRIGGVLAPIISDWLGKKVDQDMPFIIFAVVNIVAGLLCLLLPETNNTSLPTTIIEAINL